MERRGMRSGEGRVGPKLKLGPTELFSWRRRCLEERKGPYIFPEKYGEL